MKLEDRWIHKTHNNLDRKYRGCFITVRIVSDNLGSGRIYWMEFSENKSRFCVFLLKTVNLACLIET